MSERRSATGPGADAPWWRSWHLTWILGGLAAAVYGGAVLFGAITHQPTGSGTAGEWTIVAKHHSDGYYEFDIIRGRTSNTVDVSEQVYDEYKTGDAHDG